MHHYGDITKINGAEVPVVDTIIFGAPCQDLSVAGKRAGMKHGDLGDEEATRSGLFMDAVRIIKEMRAEDERNGRSGVDIRPRYGIYENVPGAFSSNHGQDFRIVLEELAKVKDKDAVIPMPEKWTNYGCIMGDGWSIAWRVFDAQFWGVPQRRRRIALVADFGGESAPEILFVRKSVSRDIEPSEQKRKETSSDASRGFGADDRLGADQYNAVILGDTVSTLGVNCGMSHGRQCFLEPMAYGISSYNSNAMKSSNPNSGIYEADTSRTLDGNGGDPSCNQGGIAIVETVPYTLKIRSGCEGGGKGALVQEDKSATLATNNDQYLFQPVYALDRASFNQGKNAQFDFEVSDKGVNSPLVAKGPGAVCYGVTSHAFPEVNYNQFRESDTELATLKAKGGTCGDGSETLIVAVDRCFQNTGVGWWKESDCAGTIRANGSQWEPENAVVSNVAKTRYIVRRLTPLECERLQGFPDGWTDIGEWTDTNGKKRQTSDAARYKALGNSISLPNWKWVLKRICACYERDATMASLFDGIGGFPLLWEQLNGKGTCLWASEIEEFPIAVTKVRIGE